MQSLRVIPNHLFRSRCQKACSSPSYRKPAINLPAYNQQYPFKIKCKYCQCCSHCCCFPDCIDNIPIYLDDKRQCLKVAEQ